MSDLIKLPHEISLWEDRLTVVYEDGTESDDFAKVSKENPVIGQYYKERKLCVIGSNTMDTQIGVVDPVLVRKTDGTSTLTFSLYAKYYDEETGEFLENPFLQYLTNERKVKLKYFPNGELRWLDFVIKKIDESSENYKFTYTATDLFINELSKTGYNLEFDAELENNQGTIDKLAGDILRGSDWEVGLDSELIQQTITESLYKITLNADLVAYDIFTNKEKIVPEGAEIYAFYSVITNKVYDYFQFIYNADNDYTQDENNIVHDVENYYCKFEEPPVWRAIEFYNKFRGERYVRSQQSTYDPVLERQVKIYVGENNEKVCGYEETEYYGPSLVQTFVTNGETILSDSGWRQEDKLDLEVGMTPDATTLDVSTPRRFYLSYNQTLSNSYLLNTGLRDNAEIIGEISKDDKFAFGITLGNSLNNNAQLRLQLIKYVLNKKEYPTKEDEILYTGIINNAQEKDFVYYLKDFSLSRAITKQELTEVDPIYRFGIFISFVDSNGQIIDNYNAQIYNMMLFRQYSGKADGQEGLILPDGRVLYESSNGVFNKTENIAESYVNIKYYYYPARTVDDNITKPEQIQYLHIGDKLEQYKEVYNSNFEKIRSISKKESNRFDLLQTLSETFECWCRFDIWHKDTGEIMLAKDAIWLLDSGDVFGDEKVAFLGGDAYSIEEITFYGGDNLLSSDNPFQQMKFVTFHSKIGQKKSIGFRYGINLKSVSRSLDSNTIATKLIVKSNTNEFAEGGSCNIALAKENPSGENFVYDFTHYINQGLMNEENLINDLYYYEDDESENNRKWIGLFVQLKGLNTSRDQLIIEQNALMQQYNHSKSDYEYGKVRLSAIEDEIYDLEAKYKGYKTDNDDYDKTNEKLLALVYDICRLKKEQSEVSITYNKAKIDMKTLEERIQVISDELKTIENATAALISTFEQKYIRFIQEASWTSEDYTDHNLYYIDAETTLHKSAQPKVSYNINVIELSQIEGYENYSFDLGDISYVIDTDFFGWTEKDGIKTPRREEIVITETSTNFHSPDKSSIKAQNYRSAFEDLFRRLTATSQQLQFHNGEFQRAADVVDANGNIAPSSLADAFANNAYILSNVANQTVKWNEFGITTTDAKNPAEITRITSGGIFLTSDGGEKWTTGITAKGINAKMITTGVLDTGKVNIYNGNQKSFTWDSQGINAYKEEGGKYQPNSFVRFSQDGIYGTNQALTDNGSQPSIEQIKEKSSFYLGWDGLHLNKGKIKFGADGVAADGLEELINVDTKDVVNEIVGEYLGGGGTTEIDGQYVISPYIGGGYLHIGKGSNSIIIDPDGVKEGEVFLINTAKGNVMFVDDDGNLSITGTITAEHGSIGGWDISPGGLGKIALGESGIWLDARPLSADDTSVYYINCQNYKETSKYFRVGKDGSIQATSGNIGGWEIKSGTLPLVESSTGANIIHNYSYLGTVGAPQNTLYISQTGYLSYVPELGNTHYIDYGTYKDQGHLCCIFAKGKFAVDINGQLFAKDAVISGVITATSGSIGDWDLTNRGLSYNDKYFFYKSWDDNDKVTIAQQKKNNWRLVLGRTGKTEKETTADGKTIYESSANFGVDADGKMYASSITLSGDCSFEKLKSNHFDDGYGIALGYQGEFYVTGIHPLTITSTSDKGQIKIGAGLARSWPYGVPTSTTASGIYIQNADGSLEIGSGGVRLFKGNTIIHKSWEDLLK